MDHERLMIYVRDVYRLSLGDLTTKSATITTINGRLMEIGQCIVENER